LAAIHRQPGAEAPVAGWMLICTARATIELGHMLVTTEVRLLVIETCVSLEAALAAAEQIAGHGIVESNSFENLMTLLEEAASAAERVKWIIASEDASAPNDDRATCLRAISNPRRLIGPGPTTTPPLRLIHSRDG
jgi:hypothetical protein